MTTVELLAALETQIADAKKKQEELTAAERARSESQDAFNVSSAKVEELRDKLTTAIGDLFPNPRVRVSK